MNINILKKHVVYTKNSGVYLSRGKACESESFCYNSVEPERCALFAERDLSEYDSNSPVYSADGKSWYFELQHVPGDEASVNVGYFDPEIIPEPDEFDVLIRPGRDGRGFCCNINNHPNTNGRNVAGKIFFPDRAWVGPIYAGVAKVRVTRERENFGFFVGEMKPIPAIRDRQIAAKFLRKKKVSAGLDLCSILCDTKSRVLVGKNPICDEMLILEASFHRGWQEGQTYEVIVEKDGEPSTMSVLVNDYRIELSDPMSTDSFIIKYAYGAKDLETMLAAYKPNWFIRDGKKPADLDTSEKNFFYMAGNYLEEDEFGPQLKEALKAAFDAKLLQPYVMAGDIPMLMLNDDIQPKQIFAIDPDIYEEFVDFVNWLNDCAVEDGKPLCESRDIRFVPM